MSTTSPRLSRAQQPITMRTVTVYKHWLTCETGCTAPHNPVRVVTFPNWRAATK